MSVHLFGIRHHGVGSAGSLRAALEALQPDCILIEGPPEADSLIPLVLDAEMQPPVALLIYNPDQPQRAAWYPFAVYSPEWQAMQYGVRQGIVVQFMDLPQKHSLALQAPPGASAPDGDPAPSPPLPLDPLGALAQVAGEADGESWWGRVVEESANPSQVFEAIHQAMTVLRQEYPSFGPQEALREAWMRTTIRRAEKDFERVAVVCGAWHTPSLSERKTTKAGDASLLKGLPSVKTMATFAPWTYSRLTLDSGYGAGIVSPGWYHHLWETPPSEVAARWLGLVATLLRQEGMLASTAQVIDGLRLAQMLALMRGRTVGLEELNEASIAALCAGHSEPLALIRTRLIVGERMGSVPAKTPAVPLRHDLTQHQKKLRLTVSPDPLALDLDLRQATDLARSHLFHRLALLKVRWAKPSHATVQSKGTFHEYWTLQWQAELDIHLIEASIWGNTIEGAAIAFAQHTAQTAQELHSISALLQHALLSDLAPAVEVAIQSLHRLASVTHDLGQLIEAVPPLVETLRYGDVRKTDATLIAPVLEGMVVRVCIGLYPASLHLDDEAAQELYLHMGQFNSALQLAQDAALLSRWHEALHPLLGASATHPLLAGMAMRLLLRAERVQTAEVTAAMRRAFSIGHESHYAAYWLEGFLSGMEHTLLRDEALFSLIDEWVISLPSEQFTSLLPLLRRTFSTFDAPARRNLAERIARGAQPAPIERIDEARAERVLPLLRQLLGV